MAARVAHHEVAGTLANLAALLAEEPRRRDEAPALVTRARAICEWLPPEHHVRVGCTALAEAVGV